MSQINSANIENNIMQPLDSHLMVRKDRVIQILQIKNDDFLYMLKMFNISPYTKSFTKTQVDLDRFKKILACAV